MAHRGVGEIRADLTVSGDVGQLKAGPNTLRMQVDGTLGTVVTVSAQDAAPTIAARPHPVRVMPAPPVVFDRVDETQSVLTELAVRRSVAIQAPPGMGTTTLLRHIAHRVPGPVVCLSARGQTLDDLLQALFTAFYASDGPVRPTRDQLRHLLQAVHAAVIFDDVDLSANDVAELQRLAPNCTFVLAGPRPCGLPAVSLSGLHVEPAGELLARVMGRPVDRGTVYALWGLTRGAPAGLVQLGVSAATYPGPVEAFVSAALQERPPPFTVADPEDHRLLGLLAAVPGLELSAEQLTTVSGLPDVHARLRPWVERGLVTASGFGTYTFAGGALDPVAWQLTHRRAELIAGFATWARRNPDAVLVAGGSAEPMRVLQELARRQRAWRAVIAMGALLDVAYAVAGRWDAWHTCLQATLEAARAVGDQAAEAMALHQLGTHALARGDLVTARAQLDAALGLRTALGQTAAAAVTRQNLAVITQQPPARRGFMAGLARIPMPVKVAVALIPLLGGLLVAFNGIAPAVAPDPKLDPAQLAFANQAVDHASAPQVIRLGNRGSGELHVDNVAISGANHGAFTLVDTSCVGAVPANGVCTATVVFTPATPGQQNASLSWHIRELAKDMASPLVGMGVTAPATAPTANPHTLTFDAQALNTLSAPLPVHVVAGSAPLRLRGTTTQGVEAADFLVDGDGCAGAALPAAADCTVNVRFTPSAAGERDALLTVADVDGHPAATVALRGTGAAPAPQVAWTVTPTSLGFGDQAVGTASAGLPVTLTNRGGAPVDLGTATIAGSDDFAITADDCPDTLAPGKACATTVTFTPSGDGPEDAQLLLGAPGRPSVPLRGSGVARPATLPVLTPSFVGFGDQLVGTVSTWRTVTVTNRGAADVRVANIGIDGRDFQRDAGCAGATLAPGGSCQLQVRFAPTRGGPYYGVLFVSVPDVPGRAAVVLRGFGTGVLVRVPNVVATPLAAAGRAVEQAGLRLGTVTPQTSPTVAKDAVIDQTPPADRWLRRGGAVDLVVSSGPAPVTMPPLVGLSQADAKKQLDGLGLRVGTITQRSDPKIAAGSVVAADPASGARVPPGSAVNLVVSSGPPVPPVAVPAVVGQSLPNARALLAQRNLAVGAVTRQPSATVPNGVVISSRPAPGATVQPSTAVALVVSSGPERAPVPNVVGGSLDAARSALAGAHLAVGTVLQQSSDTVAKGVVISSDPAAGAQVATGSRVNLVVSSGPRVEDVAVPDVAGGSLDAARSALTGAHLAVGAVSEQSSDTVAKGVVISSSPAAGDRVAAGARVNLVVSSGPVVAKVAVPDVAGRTVAEARSLVTDANLIVGVVRQQASDTVTAGQVISSRPGAGTQVVQGTPVSLVVSSGPAAATGPAVPKVVGLTVAQATVALQRAGLTAVAVDADGNPVTEGVVVGSDPPAGRPAPPDRTVRLTVQG